MQLISENWNTTPFLTNSLYAESPGKTNSSTNNEAYENYINLKKLYLKWNSRLLKRNGSYKRYLNKYLESIIDKEILTDYNYVLISPEGRYEKELICRFSLDNWLRIKGNIQQDIFAKIVEKNPGILTNWWRSRKLLSVYGRIKDFKHESSEQFGEIVILYLTDIKVKDSDDNSTGKNSK
jgi:hypothetical protein